MDYHFTEAAEKLKPSAIREILKLSSQPGIIPFSAGNPSPEAFPVDEINSITSRILKNDPIAALQYSVTEGYQPLRDYLKKYMREKYAVGTDDDDLIITCGAQQVMSLAATALAGPGDVLLCESPSFVGSLNALKLTGATVIGIPMENDGMDIEYLENTLKTTKNVRALYIIPNFQNPTGITTSAEKRKRIYELAAKYRFLIIEDNPYGDLYFDKKPPEAIKCLDTEGLVIYAGSCSKVIAPGMRVGWCVANKTLIAKLTALKQTQDVHVNILAQMIALDYMSTCDFEGHLDYLRKLYRDRAAFCIEKTEKHLSPEIKFIRPTGGLFAWCELPESIPMREFCTKAVKEYGVAVVPGNAFSVNENDKTQHFRINYSTPTSEQIADGMVRLENLKNEMLR